MEQRWNDMHRVRTDRETPVPVPRGLTWGEHGEKPAASHLSYGSTTVWLLQYPELCPGHTKIHSELRLESLVFVKWVVF